MRVAILCRGWSLRAFNFISVDIDLYIIVNDFANELDSIGHYLKDKKIHHVANRHPDSVKKMLENDFYMKFNIEKIIQPYSTTKLCEKKYGGVNNKEGNNVLYNFVEKENSGEWTGHFSLVGKSIPARTLGDNHDEIHPEEYPSSGNAAFGYAALDTDADEIILIGMDFYDVGYMSRMHSDVVNIYDQKSDKWSRNNELCYSWGLEGPSILIKSVARFENGDKMKDSVINIIAKCPNKKFTIFTSGIFRSELPNCTIHNVKPPPKYTYKLNDYE